jgi:hypothetical protein
MKTAKPLLIGIFIVSVLLVLVVSTLLYTLNMNDAAWREPGQRDMYIYNVHVEGLSGREVEGTTTIMLPIPATREGKFVASASRKEPSFIQNFVNEYILPVRMGAEYGKGPVFENATEVLANKSIDDGKWITFIAETEDGYMLGFESNESVLDDIYFSAEVVVEDIDIFDPINKDSPILYPVFDLSETSTKPYGKQVRYDSSVSYGTYVYLSDNIKDGTKSIEVSIDAHNDPTEWEKEYRGRYMVKVWDDVEGAGKIKVVATLEQEFWFPLGSE